MKTSPRINTPASIIADLRTNTPHYDAHDISACNGTGELIKSLIATRKRKNGGLDALNRKIESIEQSNPGTFEKLTTIKRKPRGILLSEVQPQEISWLWHKWLPLKKLVMLDGDPGLGKTTLICDIIARLTTGRHMPEDTGTPQTGGAVLISLEDGLEDTLQPRLARAGADLTRISSLGYLTDTTEDGQEYERPFSLSQDIGALEEEIKRVNAKIVLIDPIMAILGGHDTYKDNEVRAALAPLKSLAERCNVAIVMIRHVTKSGNDKLIYMGGGSIAFIGLSRVGWVVMKNPDNPDQVILANPKNNLQKNEQKLIYHIASEPGEDERAHLIWDGESELTDQELTRPATQAPGESRQEILRVLKENFPGAMTPQHIAEAIGEKVANVTVVLGRMAKDEQITKPARGVYKAHSGLSVSSSVDTTSSE